MAEELVFGTARAWLDSWGQQALAFRAPHRPYMQLAGAPGLAPPSQGASRPAPQARPAPPRLSDLRLGACGSAPAVRALEGKLSPNYRHARIQGWPQGPQRSQGSWLCRLLSDLWDPNSLNTSTLMLTFLGSQFPRKYDPVITTGVLGICPSASPVLPFRACSGVFGFPALSSAFYVSATRGKQGAPRACWETQGCSQTRRQCKI